MVGTRRIRSEKLREHQYRKGYARSPEGKGVEWDKDNNVDHAWEQVKPAMVECDVNVNGNRKFFWKVSNAKRGKVKVAA